MAKLNSVVDMNIDQSIKSIEKELKGTVDVEPRDLNSLKAHEEVLLKGEGRVGDLKISLSKVIRRYY